MKLGTLYRSATIEREAVNADSRTVTFSFSSEAPVKRWFGEEILDHNPTSVRLNRLKDGGPLLVEHDTARQVGVVESVELRGGKGYVTARFSKGAAGQAELDDVRDGIRRNVSVGYRVHRVVLQEDNEDRKSYRVTDWEPLEVSLVSVPADSSVGIGRAGKPEEETEVTVERRNMAEDNTPAGTAVTVDEKGILDRERKRVSELRLIGRNLSWEKEAEAAIESGETVQQFRDRFMDTELPKRAKLAVRGASLPEMEREEKRTYSYTRVLRALADRRNPDGFEGEVAQEIMKNRRGQETKGFVIPSEIFGVSSRNLTANVGSGGGYTVATDILGSEFIEKLRIQPVVERAGARRLTGLVGDVAIVSQSGAATGYWLGETAATTKSNPTFGQKLMTPHRFAVHGAVSKQLLAQSSLDVEMLLREDQNQVIAIAVDKAAIQGTGNAGEPKGLFNFDTTTSGINTVTYSAAATFAKTREAVAAVLTDNVMGTQSFLIDPTTWAKWSTKSVDTGSGVFIWQGPDGAGTVGGYPGYVSNHLPSNKSVNGVFSDMLLGWWDGFDIVVDPYTLADQGIVRIITTIMCDILVRHPEAFCISTDSAAQ